MRPTPPCWAAEAIAEGAKTGGAQVTLQTGSDAQPKDLLECDAVVLGSYDAFCYMGGRLKDFFDRAFYPTQGHVTGKPYAAFLMHGGGGKAIQSIEPVTQSFKVKEGSAGRANQRKTRMANHCRLESTRCQDGHCCWEMMYVK